MKLFRVRPLLRTAGPCLLPMAGAAFGAYLQVPIATAIPVLRLLAIVVAWRAGFRASLTVSLVARLNLDYFSTVPCHSLGVASLGDVVTLDMIAASSTVVNQLSHRTRLRADQLEHAETEQASLYEFSASVLCFRLCGVVSFKLFGVCMLPCASLQPASL